jgi:hypothetical protein
VQYCSVLAGLFCVLELSRRHINRMSSAHAGSSQLHEVVTFLSTAIQRVHAIRAGASGGRGIQEAAAAISSACDNLRPHLVRASIALSAGRAPQSAIDSFCSSSLPSLSTLASSSTIVLAAADEVRVLFTMCEQT